MNPRFLTAEQRATLEWAERCTIISPQRLGGQVSMFRRMVISGLLEVTGRKSSTTPIWATSTYRITALGRSVLAAKKGK